MPTRLSDAVHHKRNNHYVEKKKKRISHSHPIRPINSMQPSQRLNHPLHLHNISRTHLRNNLLLQSSLAIEELLNQLTVHEAIRGICRTRESSERAEFVEGEVAERIDFAGDYALERDEEVVVVGVD
jgi:hypothetical protein